MRRAIVVGASSGMGREVAKLLIADGWRVGVAARRVDKLLELKEEAVRLAGDGVSASGNGVTASGDGVGPVEVMAIDVTSEEAPQRLLELVDRLGGIDLFFYASGSGKQNLDLDVQTELNTVTLNGLGFTRMIDTMFNYMAGHGGGHIAAISSIAGTKGLGSAPSYSATKAFQATYIESLEQLAHIRRLPIRLTDIRPGFVDTALLDGPAKYPMLMRPARVARTIVRAIKHRRHVKIIDWRYAVMVFFWRLIPGCLWRNLRIVTKNK